MRIGNQSPPQNSRFPQEGRWPRSRPAHSGCVGAAGRAGGTVSHRLRCPMCCQQGKWTWRQWGSGGPVTRAEIPHSPWFSGTRGTRGIWGQALSRDWGTRLSPPTATELPANPQAAGFFPTQVRRPRGSSQPSPAAPARGSAQLDRAASCGARAGGSNLMERRTADG